MRRTGKLYTLTMVSCGLGVTASLLASRWSENSSTFHLWIDLVPQGFGMASFITTTLIVSPSARLVSIIWAYSISGHDRQRIQRRHRCCYRKYVVLLATKYDIYSYINLAVTYLFRTTGQVLGVSLSGAILQAVLLRKLRERIQGPDAARVQPATSGSPSAIR